MLTRLCVILAATSVSISCSDDDSEETVYDHVPAPVQPAPPPVDEAWTQVAPLIAANCGTCHDGRAHPLNFADKQVFKASKAKARLTAGTMPPAPRTISDGDKAALLAYLH